MAEPFLSEIKLMSFNYAPKGWALCNGQLLPINQNQALFSLIGTVYGGDGRVNFGLPNLQGRAPLHRGQGFALGQLGGEANHTLVSAEMPQHSHTFAVSSASATTNTPTAGLGLAASAGSFLYGPASNLVAMNAASVSNAGGSQAHNNMQPFLAMNFCIALTGIFPSQN